jgi:hypothetical protein
VDDGELGAAGIVGHGDDLEFDSAVIRPQVQQLIADEDGLAGVDHCGEDVGVLDLVLPARPSHPHSHWSSMSDTYDDANTREHRDPERGTLLERSAVCVHLTPEGIRVVRGCALASTAGWPNLVLVCSRHHTLIHTQGFQLALHPDRRLTVTTAGGVPVLHHPAQPWGDPATLAAGPGRHVSARTLPPDGCDARVDLGYVVSVLMAQAA